MSRGKSESAGSPLPLLALERQMGALKEVLLPAVEKIVAAQAFVLGAAVAEFERMVADYLGAGHAVGVANGTDALYLSLRAMEIRPGDEVITSAFTFFATAGAIHNAAGRPVFVDIDPETYNLDPAAVADAISERTRAIIPVHMFGQMAEREPLTGLAEKHGLWLIEDAAQAIGAKALIDGAWRGAGTVGTAGCFSFYPTKNLGGWGDGGLIVTGDDEIAERLRALRVHGQEQGLGSYRHGRVGMNSRLDAIQAAVLSVKLPHLGGWNEARRAKAAFYDRQFAGLDAIKTPRAAPDRFHVYHLYTIRAARRDELKEHLAAQGIGSGIYYPLPLHLQPCFAHLGYSEGQLPEAEAACREVISLPCFPELTAEELERVARAVTAFYAV